MACRRGHRPHAWARPGSGATMATEHPAARRGRDVTPSEPPSGGGPHGPRPAPPPRRGRHPVLDPARRRRSLRPVQWPGVRGGARGHRSEAPPRPVPRGPRRVRRRGRHDGGGGARVAARPAGGRPGRDHLGAGGPAAARALVVVPLRAEVLARRHHPRPRRCRGRTEPPRCRRRALPRPPRRGARRPCRDLGPGRAGARGDVELELRHRLAAGARRRGHRGAAPARRRSRPRLGGRPASGGAQIQLGNHIRQRHCS